MKEKTIVLSLDYGDTPNTVVVILQCDEPLDSGDVYLALSQYLDEYEKELYSDSGPVSH